MFCKLKSAFVNNECCAPRSRVDAAKAEFPSPDSQHPHSPLEKGSHGGALEKGLNDFFLKLADLCVNDPLIAQRIEDDRTCPLIWGEANSQRAHFLQMCIRDDWDHCRELWPKLAEFERRDFMQVVLFGQPSHEYFLEILVNDNPAGKEVGKEPSDCASTSSGGNSSRSSSQSMSSFASDQVRFVWSESRSSCTSGRRRRLVAV